MAWSKDSFQNTIFIAFSVCLVCSVLVTVPSVMLKEKQEYNKKIDKIENILKVASLYEAGKDPEAIFKENIKAVVLNLDSGQVMADKTVDDVADALKNAENFIQLTAETDLAGIGKIPKMVTLYEVYEAGKLAQMIFPIYGKGLWSTLYGFISLSPDGQTIQGLGYYDHGETPGLGGEVDNQKWKDIWRGKKVKDDQNKVQITVLKGAVDPTNPNSQYQVDGLSGATITSRGVHNMIRFWLGRYDSFISQMAKG